LKRGRLIVLSVPGGVGKSTVVSNLRGHSAFFLSVSVTTRKPRNGEIDGQSYHFVSTDEFQKMIDQDQFLEWADFAGARYGTLRGPVEQALGDGLNVLLEIEIQGARQVKKSIPDALMVFLEPPSFEELTERIKNRGTDSPERIQARLDLARSEMAAAREFDVILTNHRVEEVVAALVSFTAS
jgi:guanylate kinase